MHTFPFYLPVSIHDTLQSGASPCVLSDNPFLNFKLLFKRTKAGKTIDNNTSCVQGFKAVSYNAECIEVDSLINDLNAWDIAIFLQPSRVDVQANHCSVSNSTVRHKAGTPPRKGHPPSPAGGSRLRLSSNSRFGWA